MATAKHIVATIGDCKRRGSPNSTFRECDCSLIYLCHPKHRKYMCALSAVHRQSTNNQWPTDILAEEIMRRPPKDNYNDRLNIFYEKASSPQIVECVISGSGTAHSRSALDIIWSIVCLTQENHRTLDVGDKLEGPPYMLIAVLVPRKRLSLIAITMGMINMRRTLSTINVENARTQNR
jgi:hypothetical protein